MKFKAILFDVDSTLTETEGIDLLAQSSPYAREVVEITERAMQGELDFDGALRERVALLRGQSIDVIDRAIEETRISSGAHETIVQLKEQGMKVGIVSGGFREIIDSVFRGWPFDLVVAHRLEINNGSLTGKVLGDIVNREKKASVLRDFADYSGCSLEEMIAVGDGSNDIAMVELAGLGIAYRGKPALRKVADIEIESLKEIINLV